MFENKVVKRDPSGRSKALRSFSLLALSSTCPICIAFKNVNSQSSLSLPHAWCCDTAETDSPIVFHHNYILSDEIRSERQTGETFITLQREVENVGK